MENLLTRFVQKSVAYNNNDTPKTNTSYNDDDDADPITVLACGGAHQGSSSVTSDIANDELFWSCNHRNHNGREGPLRIGLGEDEDDDLSMCSSNTGDNSDIPSIITFNTNIQQIQSGGGREGDGVAKVASNDDDDDSISISTGTVSESSSSSSSSSSSYSGSSSSSRFYDAKNDDQTNSFYTRSGDSSTIGTRTTTNGSSNDDRPVLVIDVIQELKGNTTMTTKASTVTTITTTTKSIVDGIDDAETATATAAVTVGGGVHGKNGGDNLVSLNMLVRDRTLQNQKQQQRQKQHDQGVPTSTASSSSSTTTTAAMDIFQEPKEGHHQVLLMLDEVHELAKEGHNATLQTQTVLPDGIHKGHIFVTVDIDDECVTNRAPTEHRCLQHSIQAAMTDDLASVYSAPTLESAQLVLCIVIVLLSDGSIIREKNKTNRESTKDGQGQQTAEGLIREEKCYYYDGIRGIAELGLTWQLYDADTLDVYCGGLISQREEFSLLFGAGVCSFFEKNQQRGRRCLEDRISSRAATKIMSQIANSAAASSTSPPPPPPSSSSSARLSSATATNGTSCDGCGADRKTNNFCNELRAEV